MADGTYDDSRDERTLVTARSAAAITPSDTTDLNPYPEGLYIGVTGDVKVDMVAGGTVTFKAFPVGFLPCSVRRVYATGTTATNIIGVW